MAQKADKVYRNAKVYSVALDGTETHAQALAIVDGKFAIPWEFSCQKCSFNLCQWNQR